MGGCEQQRSRNHDSPDRLTVESLETKQIAGVV
jgi:hypothetical protein